VLVTCTPILFNLGAHWLDGKTISWSSILGHGDLLLVAVAIGAPPLGELKDLPLQAFLRWS